MRLVLDRFDHDWPEGMERYAIWAIGPLSEASTPRKPVVLFHKTLPKGPAWATSDLLLDLGRPSKCSAPLVAAAAEGPSGAIPAQPRPLSLRAPHGFLRSTACRPGQGLPSVPACGLLVARDRDRRQPSRHQLCTFLHFCPLFVFKTGKCTWSDELAERSGVRGDRPSTGPSYLLPHYIVRLHVQSPWQPHTCSRLSRKAMVSRVGSRV